MTPQMQQQLPPSDPSSSQYHSAYLPSLGQGDTIQIRAKEQWRDSWGAIATDAKGGKMGVASEMSEERVARATALSACEADGGKSCRVDITYVNQCVAMVVGKFGYGTAHAPTKSKATAIGLSNCKEKDEECEVYYSECSYPVLAE
jgi:hypothetical protein